MGGQGSGEPGDFVAQLIVGILLNGIGYRAVIDNGILIPATVVDMVIHGIVTGIHLPAGKPAVEGFIAVIENLVPFFIPVAVFGRRAPEAIRVLN